jgi:hypothetical protein
MLAAAKLVTDADHAGARLRGAMRAVKVPADLAAELARVTSW